jgi:hypothetical protein
MTSPVLAFFNLTTPTDEWRDCPSVPGLTLTRDGRFKYTKWSGIRRGYFEISGKQVKFEDITTKIVDGQEWSDTSYGTKIHKFGLVTSRNGGYLKLNLKIGRKDLSVHQLIEEAFFSSQEKLHYDIFRYYPEDAQKRIVAI